MRCGKISNAIGGSGRVLLQWQVPKARLKISSDCGAVGNLLTSL
jgi:hypothetical protein